MAHKIGIGISMGYVLMAVFAAIDYLRQFSSSVGTWAMLLVIVVGGAVILYLFVRILGYLLKGLAGLLKMAGK